MIGITMRAEKIMVILRCFQWIDFFVALVNSILLSSVQENGKTAILNTLKQPIRDFREESSENVAVRFNFIYALTILESIPLILFIITKKVIIIRVIIPAVCVFCVISYAFSTFPFFFYIEEKTVENPIRENLSIDVLKESISLVFFLIIFSVIWELNIPASISEKLTSDLSNDYFRCFLIILCIIYVVFLVSAGLICCYSIIGCLFFNKHQAENKKAIDMYTDKKNKLYEQLQVSTKALNERANSLTKRRLLFLIILGLKYVIQNVIIYFQEFSINYKIACQLVKYKCRGKLEKLLTKESYKTAKQWILSIATILVLIVNNLIMDNCYESEHPIAVFFRLITTIIVIPILINKISA